MMVCKFISNVCCHLFLDHVVKVKIMNHVLGIIRKINGLLLWIKGLIYLILSDLLVSSGSR